LEGIRHETDSGPQLARTTGALAALAAAAAGLFWQPANAPGLPYTFTTLHGQAAQIDGRGLYQYDTVFSAAAFRAMDVLTVIVALPLLAWGFGLYRRGSARGGLLLAGALLYFVYNGASMTFGAAFNSLFLVYTALFSASLFAFIAVLMAFDLEAFAARLAPGLPRRGLALFLFVAGLGTLGLWLSDLIGPLLAGQAPKLLGPYTTMFTHGFDSAVITPAAVMTGVFLLQRKPMGYLLAAPLLVLCTLNGVAVIAQTVSQTLAGIIFPIGVYVGMVGSWVVLGALAIWLAAAFFRNVAETESLPRRAPGQHTTSDLLKAPRRGIG
jgi:hypothetical protein